MTFHVEHRARRFWKLGCRTREELVGNKAPGFHVEHFVRLAEENRLAAKERIAHLGTCDAVIDDARWMHRL